METSFKLIPPRQEKGLETKSGGGANVMTLACGHWSSALLMDPIMDEQLVFVCSDIHNMRHKISQEFCL